MFRIVMILVPLGLLAGVGSESRFENRLGRPEAQCHLLFGDQQWRESRAARPAQRKAPPHQGYTLQRVSVRQPVQDSAEAHADKAAAFVEHDDLKSAENELRKAVELSPGDPQLLTSLGGVLGMEGRLEDANVYLARAVRLKPDEPVLRRNLAANEWQLGRFPQAQQDLERLLAANPADRVAIFLLGMVSENQKNYARSISLLESIPEVAESQPEAYVALAMG